jgi:hypothetical protein
MDFNPSTIHFSQPLRVAGSEHMDSLYYSKKCQLPFETGQLCIDIFLQHSNLSALYISVKPGKKGNNYADI